MINEERALIEGAQANSEQFAALYEKYVEQIFQFIYYRTGKHRERAEDLTAETFARAFKNLQNFTWQGHPYSAYLYTIARSIIRDEYKKMPPPIDIDEITHAKTVESNADTLADIHFMWSEIQKLPNGMGELFELRYIEDLSYDQIAEIVGKRSGTVRTAISRSIKKLNKIYEERQ